MYCSRHRDAVVRAEAAPIRSDEGVQVGLSCARPLDDLEHVGHAAAIGHSNGQGSPGVHGFDREMDHRPRCASSPDARQNETDHERDDPHDQRCDSRGTFTVWYQRSLHRHGIGFPFNERRGRRTNDCGLLWPTSPASGALEEHSGRIHPGVDHDDVSLVAGVRKGRTASSCTQFAESAESARDRLFTLFTPRSPRKFHHSATASRDGAAVPRRALRA